MLRPRLATIVAVLIGLCAALFQAAAILDRHEREFFIERP
jgi:hypothetical protein